MKRPVARPPNPIGQRLKLEMKKRGIASTELAKRAGVKTSFLYDIISGKSANPSTVKLARVAESLGVSLSALVGGTAPEAAFLSRHDAGDEYISIPRIMVDTSAGSNSIVSAEQEGESCCFRRSWIADHLRAAPGNLRLLSVRGDSMEPTLCHNDLLLIDIARKTPSPPGIFVLFDGFGLVAKRLEHLAQHQPPRLRIMSDNPQYSTYERSADETFIIGRVVWFSREI